MVRAKCEIELRFDDGWMNESVVGLPLLRVK
jgi:hypothetical protein